MTPETRTQWIIAAFLAGLLVVAIVVGSRCDRQDGDAADALSSTPPVTAA